ncbi:Uncharacterized protein conserved in archaea [Methanocella conradii HZ254]|uniref:Uncharacterized protein conserved in archaea n=1 Tax=Methanocella conradii (strain DSM 24694 / JCM 17849 / CGMCC 1.5162 / HZ254) TaxID=1041930 RepID=H8I9C3_METCZ|nr:type IV pilin [Methanocella conradii]AFC99541.1 Uncharacterized protein conserved in archaea [Methanocella conradii HZ254]MDI6897386.1 type IV pilin [Methanocella conradii]
MLKSVWDFFNDERGVENAMYSILMIAIVVIVALMIGSLVLSRGGELQALSGTPKASLSGVLESSPPTLRINHESGDPIDISKISLAVFNDDDILIGTTNVSSDSGVLSPGMQSSAITLNGSITPGNRYTVKVISTQTRQQIGMMVLVAR